MKINDVTNLLSSEAKSLEFKQEQLSSILKNTPFSIDNCKFVLFGIITSVKILQINQKMIFAHLKNSGVTFEQYAEYVKSELFEYVFDGHDIQNFEDMIKLNDKGYDKMIEKIEEVIELLDDKNERDAKKRNQLLSLNGILDAWIKTFVSLLLDPNSLGIHQLGNIAEFIFLKSVGLNERWVVATCYLASIDVIVNKKRKEFGLTNPVEKKEVNIPFDLKYHELLEYLKSKNVELDEIVSNMQEGFWKIRTQVIHYGKIPDESELEMIVKYSQKIVKMISVNV